MRLMMGHVIAQWGGTQAVSAQRIAGLSKIGLGQRVSHCSQQTHSIMKLSSLTPTVMDNGDWDHVMLVLQFSQHFFRV
jgi:hypothetical protein